MNFKGKAARIDDYDIPRLGSLIGVGEDELHAFMDVEAAGSGFDSKGRPKMLFEPHRFYAELGSGPKRDEAVRQGLARATWKVNGKVPKYPADSYPILERAMKIDAEAALRSASWGLTQILGRWHKDIGYATAAEMVDAFAADEANHLEATIMLFKLWKIDDDLNRIAKQNRDSKPSDWAEVAETWNGSGYASHGYHTKLAAAHNKWRRIRDTVWPPADYTPPSDPTPEPAPTPPTVPDEPPTAPETGVTAPKSSKIIPIAMGILVLGAIAAAVAKHMELF